MTSLNICTFNVKGLSCKKKREQVITYIKSKAVDIALLQEIHYDNKLDNSAWGKDWAGDTFLSGQSTNSLGVGILINRKSEIQFIEHNEIIVGRLQVLKLLVNNNKIAIINIYAPNNDDITFFNTLENTIADLDEFLPIVGGDFNAVQNFLKDKLNGRNDTNKKCSDKINDIKEIHDLVDIYRNFNPNAKEYTWHSNSDPPIFCRLDYFLLASSLVSNAKKCTINPGFKSDHSIVLLSILFDTLTRGPGYFKLNSSLLFDQDYKTSIKNSIKEVVDFNKETTPNILWELIKGRIRDESIKYSTYKKKLSLKKESEIEAKLHDIEEQLKKNPNDVILQQTYQTEKDNFNAINEEKIKGILIRAKADWIEGAEKNTKYFPNLESKRSEQKVLKQLKINDEIEHDHAKILEHVKQYFASLYKIDVTLDQENSDPFFQDLTKLSNEDREQYPDHLSENECFQALKDMKNNKSPGSDGLTTEFYKLFWTDIKKYLISSINYSFDTGHLTELQTQGLISLLPKKDKDILSINNWRPVSLLNVDYKIASKSIANRIKPFLQTLIN